MRKITRIVCFAGVIHWVDTLRESGVVFQLYRNIATGRTDAGTATLERWFPVVKRRAETNGKLSFAEQLLARQKASLGRETEAYDEDWSNLTPSVHELLTRVLRDDKKVLEPATVIIYARGGSWHACVSHKALGLKWWGEGGTIASALAKLEASCRAEMGQEASEGSSANMGQP